MTEATPQRTVRLRATLDSIPRYVAGKPAAEQPGRTTYKISSNENPYPPLPSVLQVVQDAMQTMNRYPDMGTVALRGRDRRALRRRPRPGRDRHRQCRPARHAPADHLRGRRRGRLRVAVLRGLPDRRRTVRRDRHPGAVGRRGAPRPARDGRRDHRPHPTDHRLLPEQPHRSGGAVRRARGVPRSRAVRRVGRARRGLPGVQPRRRRSRRLGRMALPPECRCAADLFEGLRSRRAARRLLHRPRAGRVGTADRGRAVRGLHVAQQAAIASLAAYDELDERVQALVAERDRLLLGLRDLGYAAPDTQANFVWLPLEDRTLDFAAAAETAGVVVRPFAGDGVRCSVGEVEATDRLLEVAKSWSSRASS